QTEPAPGPGSRGSHRSQGDPGPIAHGGHLTVGWLPRVLLSWLILALAFYVTTRLIPGIQVTGGAVGYLEVALVFGLINAILGPILRFATFPLTILTLGFFILVVNCFLLWISEHMIGV